MKIRFLRAPKTTELGDDDPRFQIGDVRDLPDPSGERWLRRGAAVEVTDDAATDEEPSREQAIEDAINNLEVGHEDHWTKAGKPEVKALEAALGFDISAAERDAAWESVSKESA